MALGLLLTLLLGACGAGVPAPTLEPPAGAADGRSTFIFFYTDG